MKTFVLSDNSVNCFGFRVLTSGIDVPRFQRNPIMLWMHTRGGTGSGADQVLPLGTWKNIRVEGDRLLAEPEFDPTDNFAATIRTKVEAGIIRMASIGIAEGDLDESPALKLPGQTGGTVTRCTLREASIVDIGANPNAIALYAGGSNHPLPSSAIPLHLAQLSAVGNGFDPITNDPAFTLSYNELHESPGLALLKSRNYPLYCLKYFQEFGKFPKGNHLDGATEQRLKALASNVELSALRAMDYDALMRSGKMGQLKAMDKHEYYIKYAAKFGKLPS